jgi:murein DD-endopeptidase MepM/ murein hydrolase activator NlpD
VRIERHEKGLDGRSGRYVRIQHEDGTLTSYMHLDQIVADLHVGDRVSAGQVIGTLGATACYEAPAHLHFSLEVPTVAHERGDITDTRYVDPAPFLQHATVISEPRGEAIAAHISS